MSKSAPRGALVSPQWSLPNQPLTPEFDADALVRRAYLRNIYAYRAVNYIANNIASLPFRVGTGKKGDSFRESHPLARLLGPAPGSPNPMWAPGMFWRYAIAQYLVMGKIAWLPEYAGNRVVGLWPLPAQHVRPILADPKSTEPHYFKGYKYGTLGTQEYREYKPNELIYLWRPSMVDPRQPESPLDVGSAEINIATLVNQFDQAFLQNGGVPSHLVVTDTFEADEERRAFQSQFGRQFGGAQNTGKPMFAERDIEYGEAGGQVDPVQIIKVGQSQIDSQLDALRDSKISDITVMFGVALSLLGESRVQKYSNMQEDRRNAWTETIRPAMRDLEDLVNTHVAPLFDKDTVSWFEVEHVNELRPTPRFADADATKLVQGGLITENEYRADRGLPPLTAKQIEAMAPALEPTVDPATDGEVTSDDKVVPIKPLKKDKPAQVKRKEPVAISRAGYLDVARTLAESLVHDMVDSMERRAAGRRKDRPALDEPYWVRRSITVLDPPLRAAGVTEEQVASLADWVVSLVRRGLADEARTLVSAVHNDVPAHEVEQALIKIATGTVTRDHALTLIQGETA